MSNKNTVIIFWGDCEICALFCQKSQVKLTKREEKLDEQFFSPDILEPEYPLKKDINLFDTKTLFLLVLITDTA